MRNLIIISLLLATIAGFGQTKTENNTGPEKKGCMKLNSIYLNANKYSIQDELFGSDNYNNNDFLGFDMSKMYHKGDYNSMGGMLNVSQINIGVGLSPYCKKLGDYNKKQEFRIALSYTRGTRSLTDYSETFPYAGETFVSPNGTINSDTLKTKSITTSERLTELGVDLSYVFRTDQKKVVSLFTGVGLNTGYAITSDLLTNTSYKARIVYNIAGDKFDGSDNISKKEPESELGSVDASILLRPYIPFGINFRLAKTHKFFSKMNLYIQGQAGMEYQQMLNGSDYYIKPLMSMGFGIKYTL
jgi:hypothetical protein